MSGLSHSRNRDKVQDEYLHVSAGANLQIDRCGLAAQLLIHMKAYSFHFVQGSKEFISLDVSGKSRVMHFRIGAQAREATNSGTFLEQTQVNA